jgi:hypothetical protein
LKLKKSEFLSNLTKQNNIPSPRAGELYSELIVLLDGIAQNRADKISTKELMKDKSKNLSRIEADLVENWLLKAISHNDSYAYAYNYLAQKMNRRAKWAMHALREISEAELFILLSGIEPAAPEQPKPSSPLTDTSKIQSPEGKRKKPVKSFPEFFDANNSSAFAEALKKKFAKDNPTTLTVLVHTLRHEFEKPLLIINSGEFSMFHKAMQDYFVGIDIGRRQLYNRDKTVFSIQYKDVVRNCKSRRLSILKSIDN